MSIRKLAGLSAGFALAAGLIGTGVSATWSSQVTAQENINVGSFGCAIVAMNGVATTPTQSVTFDAPDIISSAPGQAPFSFTVKNTGTVPQVLTVSSAMAGLPTQYFSDLLGAPSPVGLAGHDTHVYNGGLSWSDLTGYPFGASGNIKYTVHCNEGSVVFDNTPAVLPASLPSQPFQAQQTFEWGSQVVLAGTARHLQTATVTMVTWAPQAQWPTVGTAAGWTHPITLNLYSASVPVANLPGTLIKTVTQTFAIPWRPAADPTCSTPTQWRAADGCHNGYAFNITFDLNSVVAPDNLIFGIAYNTETYGVAPIRTDGPYDSLNVATYPGTGPVTPGPQASIGTFADPTIVFWNTVTAAWYTDAGAGGVGFFRKDTNWGGLEPAIQFTAN